MNVFGAVFIGFYAWLCILRPVLAVFLWKKYRVSTVSAYLALRKKGNY